MIQNEDYKKDLLELYDEDFVNKFITSDTELYHFAYDKYDIKIANKLLGLKDKQTFWDKVKYYTKNISSDKSLSNWQRLAELRYCQLENR